MTEKQSYQAFWQEEALSTRWKRLKEKVYVRFLLLIFIFFLILIAFIFGVLIFKGSCVFSWKFLTTIPQHSMTQGGIFPAIVGTIMITCVSAVVSIFFGIIAGIYLVEYSSSGFLKDMVWLAVKNLASIPSVIYGLFGVALFVETFSMQKSILTAGLTLGSLTLPVVITATVESIRSVPFVLKQAALGLGSSHWQTVYKILLPTAFPGIFTGVILAITRSVGETAPILFTGVVYYLSSPQYSLTSPFMALPYHIFALITQNSQEAQASRMAYGSSLVLVLLVLLFSLFGFFIRAKIQKNRSL